MLNCIYSQILTKQHSIGSKISNLNFVAIYFGHLTICLANLVFFNASVNSSSAHPPWANPRAFLKKLGKFPGVGTHKLSKCPGVGTKKEGNCPAPGIVTFQHFCSFFIKQWIKRSNFQYFNAMVLKTPRTTVHASLFWLYFIFLYIYIYFFKFCNFFIFLFFTLSL